MASGDVTVNVMGLGKLKQAAETAVDMEAQFRDGTFEVCPWCGGFEGVDPTAPGVIVYGFHDHTVGCQLQDLLRLLGAES